MKRERKEGKEEEKMERGREEERGKGGGGERKIYLFHKSKCNIITNNL